RHHSLISDLRRRAAACYHPPPTWLHISRGRVRRGGRDSGFRRNSPTSGGLRLWRGAIHARCCNSFMGQPSFGETRLRRLLMRRLWYCILFAALIVVGCRAIPSRPTVPEAHEVRVGQLVLHSDFDLPADHRLVRELVEERDEIFRTLGLTATNETIDV